MLFDADRERKPLTEQAAGKVSPRYSTEYRYCKQYSSTEAEARQHIIHAAVRRIGVEAFLHRQLCSPQTSNNRAIL